MSQKMNRHTYADLITGDLKWLLEQPRTLEREHIAEIVRASAGHEYNDPVDVRARLAAAEAELKIAWADCADGTCRACCKCCDASTARADAAEKLAAAQLATLAEHQKVRVEQLRAERDAALAQLAEAKRTIDHLDARLLWFTGVADNISHPDATIAKLESALARVARLEAALEDIVTNYGDGNRAGPILKKIRAALRAEGTGT